MSKSKIDEAVGKITEKDIKRLHKAVKPRKKYISQDFFKILTILAVILTVIFIFIFWKFNVVDFPTFKQYGGKSRIHLLSYCEIEKFRCRTSKLENSSIVLNIKNNFNEIASIKEISFGNCTNENDIVLGAGDKTSVLVSCESYEDMKVTYQRSSGITHESKGGVFYLIDLTKIFKFFI